MKVFKKFSKNEVFDIAQNLGCGSVKSKQQAVKFIIETLKSVENPNKFQRVKFLSTGATGKTFLVVPLEAPHCGIFYAQKTFYREKSIKNLLLENSLQSKASEFGICPRIINTDIENKTITMQLMQKHLYTEMKHKKRLTIKRQKELFNIFLKLDQAKVFHADSNILNYMIDKHDNVKIIDFGMSKNIDDQLIKKLGTDKPNRKFMTLGLVLKLRELGFDKKSYSFLEKNL